MRLCTTVSKVFLFSTFYFPFASSRFLNNPFCTCHFWPPLIQFLKLVNYTNSSPIISSSPSSILQWSFGAFLWVSRKVLMYSVLLYLWLMKSDCFSQESPNHPGAQKHFLDKTSCALCSDAKPIVLLGHLRDFPVYQKKKNRE